MTMKELLIASVAVLALMSADQPALAQDANSQAEATYQDIAKTYGFVPGFAKTYPKHAISGAWQMSKALEMSPDNKLDPKMKSLINLAVAAQIPCRYCIWIETEMAKKAGASEDEISEAVAQAAYVRHWSTVLNGMQIDFDQFKKEFGGQ
jgi:AhpD family alkylhydroperoxidase